MAKFRNPLNKINKRTSRKSEVSKAGGDSVKKTASASRMSSDVQQRGASGAQSRRGAVTAVTAENKSRLGFGFLIIAICFTILIFRLAFWQVIRADDLDAKAAEMQKIDTELDPIRGNIYDRNKKVLAQTVTKYELYGYSQNLYKNKELDKAAKEKNLSELTRLAGAERKDMKKILSGKDNLVLLAKGLDQEQVNKAQKLWGGDIVVKTKVTRSYPNGTFASTLLGSVDNKNVGLNGLEFQYNEKLAGIKGRVVRTTDIYGNALSVGSSKYYSPKNGDSLVTTIDEVIQHYVEDALSEGMKDTGAESITCIVMNPKTGDILAMASTPSYDPNNPYTPSGDEAKKFKELGTKDKSAYLSRMWTNPAVSGLYEPGSTFKLVTAASAIESGTTTDASRYSDPGYINVDGNSLKCWSPVPHGTQNITEAVGNSCNPALARVALDMGKYNFYKYIDIFGFTQKTRVDLPGEADSIVKNQSAVSNVDIATMGYGHGIAISPIQLMTAINSLGNNGVMMQSKVVKQVVGPDGKVKKTVRDRRVRQTVSKGTADKMRSIMEYYVAEGGGTSAYLPGYRVGGKTGTANIAENSGYSEQTIASFIAMAPMDDPQISILVMVTRPKKSIFGAANAGPIVKRILEKTLIYKGVERKYSKSEQSELAKAEVTVPDVTGINSSEAISKIEAAGLKAKKMPEGTGDSFLVIDQYPKKGDKLAKGGTVYIYSE